MPDLVLDVPRREAKELIVEAFERTDGISKITTSSHQVVGKTGISFPRVLWSYGETVYADLSESKDGDRTPISISGEKRVALNVGANPEKFQRRLIDEIDELR